MVFVGLYACAVLDPGLQYDPNRTPSPIVDSVLVSEGLRV